MALVIKDRVRQTSTTAGTGTITLSGSVTGYQDFTVIGTGNTTYYTIADQSGSNWEVGLGTWTSPNQLSRDTVYESSNGNALVNFGSNIKDVFVTLPAEGFASPPAIGGTTPNTITGTVITAKDGGASAFVIDDSNGTGVTCTFNIDQITYSPVISATDGTTNYPLQLDTGVIFPSGVDLNVGSNNALVLSNSFGGNTVSLKAATSAFVGYTLTFPTTAGSANQVLKTDGSGNLSWTTQGVQAAPNSINTIISATYTVATNDQYLICNRSGTVTLTLPNPNTNICRSLNIKTTSANTVVSASSNVVPLAGGAASTAILAATAGKFATLVSDGSNWVIMAAN